MSGSPRCQCRGMCGFERGECYKYDTATYAYVYACDLDVPVQLCSDCSLVALRNDLVYQVTNDD